jgi:hypothetical protein
MSLINLNLATKENTVMILSELISNIDKSEKNSNSPDIEHYSNELGVINNSWFDEPDKIKVFWLWKRYDTGSYVGIEAIYLEDEFIGLNTTTGRKNGKGELEFVSKEAPIKLREYIVSLMNDDDDEDNISIIDMTEEMGEGIPLSYSSQLLTKKLFCTLNNETVYVTDSWERDKDHKKWSLVEVKNESGTSEIRNLNKGLVIPYCQAN